MKKRVLGVATFGVVILLVVGLFVIGGINRRGQENVGKLKIIATNFPAYDFARAVTRDVDEAEVRMLIKPGAETHDFEPTPQDIIDIERSDAFIYVGGESDEWISGILSDVNPEKTKVLKMMEMVEVVEEEQVEGMESDDTTEKSESTNTGDEKDDDATGEDEEYPGGMANRENEPTEYDEHVWTSLRNSEKIVTKIAEELVAINPERREQFLQSAKNYVAELEEIDQEMTAVVDEAERRELIFGDRFPLRYFVDDYDLAYYAAFPGCSEQTEASAQTVAFLVDKVQSDDIPVVLKLELSGGKIAEKIAEATGAKVLTFQAGHNVSREDFEAGKTYAEIMRENVEVLKEALN